VNTVSIIYGIIFEFRTEDSELVIPSCSATTKMGKRDKRVVC